MIRGFIRRREDLIFSRKFIVSRSSRATEEAIQETELQVLGSISTPTTFVMVTIRTRSLTSQKLHVSNLNYR